MIFIHQLAGKQKRVRFLIGKVIILDLRP